MENSHVGKKKMITSTVVHMCTVYSKITELSLVFECFLD